MRPVRWPSLILLAWTLAAAPAMAAGQSPAALAADIDRLRAQMVETAGAAQNLEAEITRLEARLADLNARAEAKTAALADRHGQLSGTVGALVRLARLPAEALLVAPGSANDTVRTAILLRVAVPELERRAAVLRAELTALDDLRTRIRGDRQQLIDSQAALKAQQAELADLVAQRRALIRRTAAERAAIAERVATLTDQARDLRDLVAGVLAAPPSLEARPPADASQGPDRPAQATDAVINVADRLRRAPMSGARGQLRPPARGQVLRAFGEADEVGMATRGAVLNTRPGAQVVAPWHGRVAFAGPFGGYRHVLILEHGEGYHTVIAGLARSFPAVGQWVVAGEPIGAMAENATEGNPELYVELRRHSQPIDPLPWMAAGTMRAKG